MSRPIVYIDGREGTTGLQIYDRLSAREDIELLLIDGEKRKDPAERARLMNGADIVFLCLPDAAAVEAMSLIDSGSTRVIDGWPTRGAMPPDFWPWSGPWWSGAYFPPLPK